MNGTLDGLDTAQVAAVAGAPLAWVFASVGSTMDEAHRLAESGAPSGALVVSDVQRAGRGRLGRVWSSAAGQGLWMTSIHRGVDTRALDCLTIRVGLQLAQALDAHAGEPVRIKWPNDLILRAGKLGGILVETRWRDMSLEWVAVGVGVNLRVPHDQPRAAALVPDTRRRDVLAAVAPAVRFACQCVGDLSADELRSFASRDAVRDAAIVEPAVGRARGIDATGALLVDSAEGRQLFRRGSLVLAPEAS
ncbi:MAG TPA: biotin--[acetyl-CoA-carboxylase] ligase [Gemmatimonadaceae bacterium]|nr:biotin--[acetyl-CoA-carboxylase] ligase [Gemmatimonadaceae bacterium]